MRFHSQQIPLLSVGVLVQSVFPYSGNRLLYIEPGELRDNARRIDCSPSNFRIYKTKSVAPVLAAAAVCFLALSILFANSAQAQCDPHNCNPETWKWETRVIHLPDFPHCPIELVYKSRVCDQSITELRLAGFTLQQDDDPDCLQLYGYLVSPEGDVRIDRLKTTFEDMFKELTIELFLEFYFPLPTELKETYHCPNGLRLYRGYWDACQKFQVCFWSTGPFSADLIECDNAICCSEVLELCFNPDSGEVEQRSTYTPAEGENCGEPEIQFYGPCLSYGCFPFCNYNPQLELRGVPEPVDQSGEAVDQCGKLIENIEITVLDGMQVLVQFGPELNFHDRSVFRADMYDLLGRRLASSGPTSTKIDETLIQLDKQLIHLSPVTGGGVPAMGQPLLLVLRLTDSPDGSISRDCTAVRKLILMPE